MMPKMDGMETTQKLRGLGYKGVIVALTANAIVGNEGMFMQNGFDGFISKPIDIRQLNASLNHYVRDAHPEEAKKYRSEIALGSPHPIAENDEMTLQVKRIFCNEAARAIITMKGTLAAGDIKLFTTTVHGMKSALANIGEYKASALAGVLEDYAQRENISYIAANISSFIDTLEVLIKNNTITEPVPEGDENVEEDVFYLKEQMEAVIAACGEYDIVTAYAALDLLKEKPWKAATSASFDRIRDILAIDSDFDEAVVKAKELTERGKA
jgi:uncharacterized protein YacL (UPF0231 family)